MNAGAALYVGGLTPTYREGVTAAEKGVDSRADMKGLERLRAAYSGA